MRDFQTLLLVLGLGFVRSIHFELSLDFIKDKLNEEQEFLQGLLKQKWQSLGHSENIALNFQSLKAENSKSSDPNHGVEFTLDGIVGSNPFTSVVDMTYVRLPPYGPFVNDLTHSLVIQGVEDEALRSDVHKSVDYFILSLQNYTYHHIKDSSQYFAALHFASHSLVRLSSRMYTDGLSVFLDLSSSDLQITKNTREPSKPYEKLDKQHRYFGVSVHDKYLEDVLVDLIEVRKELCIHYELNARNLSSYNKYLRLGVIQQLFPELAEEYGTDTNFTFVFNSINATISQNETVLNNNKVNFKKDSAEIIITASFAFKVHDPKTFVPFSDIDWWTLVRTGVFSISLQSLIKQNPKNPLEFTLKPNVQLKRFDMIDPRIEDEEEQVMELESQAIKGIGNLAIKKFMKKAVTELSEEHLNYLNYAGFSNLITLNLNNGLLDLVFNRHSPRKDFKVDFDVNQSTDGLSQAFERAVWKRQQKYEKDLRKNQIVQEKQENKNEEIKVEL
ncbi:UNKNOWN [Stylonychia lemnae]|uniref:Uncharacterized protein n=1 Tax=Stylonychia lemnae TaxID=5949 RepID=A0A078AKW9_STYLE|nr:UNKNOWN [Stylonychia lemnae]|eukprot:CDW82087.1 UNKNOWN [Stylonychia lemnae]